MKRHPTNHVYVVSYLPTRRASGVSGALPHDLAKYVQTKKHCTITTAHFIASYTPSSIHRPHHQNQHHDPQPWCRQSLALSDGDHGVAVVMTRDAALAQVAVTKWTKKKKRRRRMLHRR